MTITARLMSVLRWIWRRDRAEQALSQELQAYLDLSAADKMRDGVSEAEARRLARLELGGVEAVKERVRRERHGGWLDEAGRDVRYALRMLARTPSFTAVVVLTLALGIGANTAIFSVVDPLLLRWLPVREPHQLVRVALTSRDGPDNPFGGLSYAIVAMLAEQREVFEGVGGFSAWRLDVGPSDAVTRVPAAIVTGGFYRTLGLEPRAGRLLMPSDDAPGAPPVAVISDGYWERQYGRSPDAIGRSLLIDGRAVPIVGVTPRGFVGATVGATADITLTVAALPQVNPGSAALLGKGNFWLVAIARPRAGLSIDEATQRLDAAWRRLADTVIAPHWPASQRADVAGQVFRLMPGGTGWSFLRTIYRTPLLILTTMVGVVLLVACANVAGLLLSRASSRQREMALRLALGAGRGRVVRQLFTEGLVLAFAGAVLGTAVAWAASRALVALMSTRNLQIDLDLSPNPRVLAFTAATAMLTAVIFALVPARQATRTDTAGALAAGSRVSRSRSRWLAGLVVGQVALALVLLAGAGLFVRTFGNLQRLDPGFDADGVAIVDLDTRRLGSRDLVGEIAALPGIVAVSLATHTPLSGSWWGEPFVPAGQPVPDRDTATAIGAGPGYFTTLGIRILAGRAFAASDTAAGAPVAIVSEAFARRRFPGQSALGQRLAAKVRRQPTELTIVGIAANTKIGGLREPAPDTVYLALAQLPGDGPVSLLVRGSGSAGSVVRAIEPAVRAAMPGAPVEIDALSSQVGGTIVQERVLALLAAGFGVLALGLAAVGLYGLIAYGVAQRTQELGVRLALGARRSQVAGLVVGEGLRLVAIGVALGLPAAWLASRWVQSLLFGVTPADPMSALGAIGLLAGAALVAAYGPARRASRTDPLVALRHD